MSYFRPMLEMANEDFETVLGTKVTGDHLLEFDLSQPTFIKLIIGNAVIELVCEPQDVLIVHYSAGKSKVAGPNSAGHNYYNEIYNLPRLDKFLKLRAVFESHYSEDPVNLMRHVGREMDRQSEWVDSLLKKGLVSSAYAGLMKKQISALLAWEVGEQCDRWLSKDGRGGSWEASQVKSILFKKVDPLDQNLTRCLAMGYYFTYFSELNRRVKATCPPADMIMEDVSFYCHADTKLQQYLWGSSLLMHHKYNPDRKMTCDGYNRYRARFGGNSIDNYLGALGICTERNQVPVQILEPFDSDLFTFIAFSLPGKNLLIDIWATWCTPCKIEFRGYDSVFYKAMEQRNVHLVFMSIDKPELRSRWKSEVETYGLKGFHVLAGPKLQRSLSEVVFDGGNFVIPRYVFVGSDGRVLSVNMPPPSNPAFYRTLTDLLK